jgi:hypothetical protein
MAPQDQWTHISFEPFHSVVSISCDVCHVGDFVSLQDVQLEPVSGLVYGSSHAEHQVTD